MAESLLGPIVLVTGFFGAFFVLVTAMSPVIIEAQRPYATMVAPPSLTDVFLEEYLTDWDPSPYEVSPEDADSLWDVRSDPMVTFDPGDEEHPLKCWLIRDDPWEAASPDYLVFQQIYGWFGTKELHTFVPYGMILDAYDENTNYSRITIDLRYTFELFFWTNAEDGLPSVLWEDGYNITAGVGLNDTLDSMSPWSMVSKIMTFRLPGTNWVLALLVATPIYMMLFYMGFVIIRSCIPLLGG